MPDKKSDTLVSAPISTSLLIDCLLSLARSLAVTNTNHGVSIAHVKVTFEMLGLKCAEEMPRFHVQHQAQSRRSESCDTAAQFTALASEASQRSLAYV